MSNIDWKKVGIGALIAMAGAGLTYASEFVTSTDFGVYTPLVTAAMAVAVNAFRKWQQGRNS